MPVMPFDTDQSTYPPPPVHFQIPSFVCSTAPTLAPGGGAEVLPVSLLSENSLAQTWFSNTGFSPHSFDDRYPSDGQHHHQESFQAPRSYVQPNHHSQQQQQQYSSSAPFEFDSYIAPSAQASPFPRLRTLTPAELSAFVQPQPASLHPHLPPPPPPPPPPGLTAPSPLGLPVYSASGFDLLSILARVANRPHPRVILGPVDMTCSFVVVDVRRFDHPIVYCSPTFCHLTGYTEHEILGRNCRFLQAPNGQVQRGETRRFTDHGAVVHLKKNLGADKECQTSIINYKKDGTAFMNLVTVIPISGGVAGGPHEEAEIVYHVGFQVDLTEQPNVILEKLRDGSYLIDYSLQRSLLSQPSPLSLHNIGHLKDRKSQAIPSIRMSRDLKKLLADPAFVRSIPISSATTVPPQSSAARVETDNGLPVSGGNQFLHLLLLETSPDFIHVVSLKGNFLYVAPSVRRVLGYEPEEMVGKSISDYAHFEDVIPLMRELKEGSATGVAAGVTASDGGGGGGGGSSAGGVGAATTGTDLAQLHSSGVPVAPRVVDLLFRARTKAGAYVWIECKGRLHVEPGKGRKAIVLSGRAKEMPRLGWHQVARGGGLNMPAPAASREGGGGALRHTEVWGMMSTGRGGGGVVSFLVVGAAVADLLGWNPMDLVGREMDKFVVDGAQALVDEVRLLDGGDEVSSPRKVFCTMLHKNGSTVDALFVLYRSGCDPSVTQSAKGVVRVPLIYQLRSVQPYETPNHPSPLVHPLTGDVFEELDTSRESSWQYELQQIRFSNQRLEDEIAAMEKQLAEAEELQKKVLDEFQQNPHEVLGHRYAQAVPSSSSLQAPQFSHPTAVHPATAHQYHFLQHHEQPPCLSNTPVHHYPMAAPGTFVASPRPQPSMPSGITTPTMPLSHNWDAALFMQNQRPHSRRQGIKRSWDIAMRQ